MTKKFTESLFILIFLNLLVKPFYIFAIDRNIQNLVGAKEYGIYFSLYGFSLLFNIISDFGITNYNNRNIAINPNQLETQLGNLIPIKIFLTIAYCIIALLSAFFINYTQEQISLLIWLVINQVLLSFIIYLRSNISGIQLFNTDSVISIIDKILLIIICSFLLWGSFSINFNIKYFVFAQTFSYIITFLAAFHIIYTRSGSIKLKFHFKTSVHILKNSFPYAILMFLMIAYSRIDSVLLERLLPDGKIQTGIYAQAYRLIDAISMFAYLFASILLPLFARMIKQQKSITEILNHSFNLLFIPSLGLIAALLLYAKEFMGLLYHQHISESALVLQYLLFSYLGISFTYIFGTLLTASGDIMLLNKISLVGLICNVILNVLLISNYGIIGAAISSMSTQLAMGLIQMLMAYKKFKIKINYMLIIKYSFLILSISIFSLFIKEKEMNWHYTIFIIPVFSIAAGFLFKLIRKNNFRELFVSS